MNNKALWFLIAACSAWALEVVFRTPVMQQNLTSSWAVSFVTSIMIMLLLGLYRPQLWKEGYVEIKSNIKLYLLVGALGVIGYAFFFAAIGVMSSATIPSIAEKIQAVIVMLLSAFFLKESVSKKKIPYMVLSLISIYFVSVSDPLAGLEGTNAILGSLYAIGAAAAWGGLTVAAKWMLDSKTSPLLFTFSRFTVANILSIPLMLIPSFWGIAEVDGTSGLITLAWTSVLTAFGFVWYYSALKRLPATLLAFGELLLPALVALFSFIILGEQLTITQWLGAIVMLICSRMIVAKETV